MKNLSLLALVICAGLPLAAQAVAVSGLTVSKGDANVTLYGVLDAGVARVDHTLGFEPGNSELVNPTANKVGNTAAIGMFNGGISPSRWGLKGGVGIVDGYRAIFLLESAINVPNGTVSNAAQTVAQSTGSTGSQFSSNDSANSGQLFARGAYLGVESTQYGTLTFGRQQSLMLDVIGDFDAVQGSQSFSPLGYSGSYGGGGATDDSRLDNAVKYKMKFGAFNLGLQHKFGGVTNNANTGSAEQVTLGYENGPFAVQAAYQGNKDATSISNNYIAAQTITVGAATYTIPASSGIKATFEDTVSYSLMARYRVGKWAIKGGYQKQEFTNPSNPGTDSQVTSLYGQSVTAVSVTPFTVNGGNVQKDLNVYWLGAAYDVTSQLNLAVGYYQVDQNNYSNHAAFANQAASGKSKYESILADYRFNKAVDCYLGYMVNVVSGGMANSGAAGTKAAANYIYSNNSIIGLGGRLKF